MRSRYDRRGKKSHVKRVLIIAALIGLVWLGLAAFLTGGRPLVEIGSDLPGIGPSTRISVAASESRRGLSRLTVELLQGDLRQMLLERDYETPEPWRPWGPKTESDTVAVEVGRQAQPELVAGEAVIRVTAGRAPAWLRRGAPTVEELRLPVRLTPPLVQVLSSQHYVAQGGSEAVVYRVGESATRHGVEVGGWFFPGQPLPGGEDGEMFALFGAPYDNADASAIRLVAADDVGNEYGRNFVDQFSPRPMRADTIRLSKSFM